MFTTIKVPILVTRIIYNAGNRPDPGGTEDELTDILIKLHIVPAAVMNG